MLTQDYLKSILDYNQDTGIFTWKNISKKSTRTVGSIAGSDSHGYIAIKINQKKYLAHRLAWLYVYGEIPIVIDHINNDKSDNRIINLRNCTRSQNSCNAKLSKRNTSGIKGISWCKRSKKWQVYIRFNGKQNNLGLFDNIDDAQNKIYEVRNKLHGKFANHGE